ncbi:MAG: transposase, partial [Candidatus Aminicenantes bacterium]|nr:transposase [Candidatus Aminicenantes bacterium]
MFVKKVRKRNGVTKKYYEYLHLVESVRTERGPRQRLILNLGNLDISPSQYQAFAKRVEDILTGQR